MKRTLWRRHEYKFKLLIVMAIVVLFIIPHNVFAVTIEGLTYTTSNIGNTNAFDVRGKINGGSSYNFKTTYSYRGYSIDFEVDGNNYSMRKVGNGTTIINNGVELKLTYETIDNGLDVNLSINNPEGNGVHAWKLAMTADIQLGSNDYAAIYKKNHNGLVITQDDPTKSDDYGAKIFIDFTPSVDTLWIGFYGHRSNNKYVESERNAYTVADKMDTGAAWSWSGELADDESVNLTTSYSLVETEKTRVNFYDINGDFVEEREALVGGAVELPSLSDPDEGYLHLWCRDAVDSVSCYSGGDSVIVENENMNFYETYRVDPGYIDTSTVRFYDINSDLVDEQEVAVGENVTLPELSEPEEGYLHLWCKDSVDGEACYVGGDLVVVESDKVDFYEVYREDPNYVAAVILKFYNADNEVVEEREVVVGEPTTLPSLASADEGYLHLWCIDNVEAQVCYNGGDTIIVEDRDTDFYEVYREDPDYVSTSIVRFYDVDGGVLEEREVAVGESTVLPYLTPADDGHLHLWCRNNNDSEICYNSEAPVLVEDEDMDFYEVYREDPEYVETSVIKFYDTDGGVTEEREAVVGEPTILPSLASADEGYLHLWCTADDVCYEGDVEIIVESGDVDFYETYKEDPNYTKDDKNTDDITNNNVVTSIATDDVISPMTTYDTVSYVWYVDEEETVAVPDGDAGLDTEKNRDDGFVKVEPLGVRESISGDGGWDWGVLKWLLPCLALMLFLFFFFIILLFKRRKDDEDEDENQVN